MRNKGKALKKALLLKSLYRNVRELTERIHKHRLQATSFTSSGEHVDEAVADENIQRFIALGDALEESSALRRVSNARARLGSADESQLPAQDGIKHRLGQVPALGVCREQDVPREHILDRINAVDGRRRKRAIFPDPDSQ
ncbi:hypothetical protein SELMODRAFT_414823 [Selaginella moellendorffii]|uniref:Uncharacterized protein n=1 Tax=Selaginella moellendorffii TaxID=88036 RepID=D8RUR9_SELML|nr:hypothetical protein SELMODRAFT_414823 [Selaginella moellendorffii]